MTDTETDLAGTSVGSSQTRSVPALPGFAPRAPVAAETVQVVTDLVNALIPVGAFRTDDHRYYMNGEGPNPSVTTVLSILDKPAIVTWKAKETARALMHADTTQLAGMSEDEQILWALKEADKARDTAASLGSSVHLLADLIGNAPQGQEKPLEGFEISKEQYPYVQAYRHFLDRYDASSIVSSEKMVWSLNGYAGTYDLLMMLPTGGALLTRDMNEPLDPELWLIDIKTSKGFYPEYGLQLAAYRYADSIILPGDPRLYPMPLIQRTGILHLRPDLYPDTGWRLIEYPTTDRDWIAFLGALEVYNWKQEKRFLKSKLSISKP